jgi:hypothetical protein
MKKNIYLFLAFIAITFSGCKMAGETKSGWYPIQLKDNSGEASGKEFLQVNGEALSRGLHQAVLQYHTNYSTSTVNARELFIIITNRRNSEDYILITTADGKKFKFPVYAGGLIFDMKGATANEGSSSDEEISSIAKLVELMNRYDELKISQGSYYFTINTAGFKNK